MYEQSTSTLVATSEGGTFKMKYSGQDPYSGEQKPGASAINWKKVMLNQYMGEVQLEKSQKNSMRAQMNKTTAGSVKGGKKPIDIAPLETEI